MLADEHARAIEIVASGGGEIDESVRLTMSGPRVAQRFVLSPFAVQTCAELADPAKIERSRDYIFAPAVATWIEWQGDTPGFYRRSRRHGLMIDGRGGIGHGAILAGTTTYVCDALDGQRQVLVGIPFGHDLQAADSAILTPDAGLSGVDRGAVVDAVLAGIDVEVMGAFLAAACALIATPRISTLVEHPMDRLNRRRAQREKVPLLSWREVRIRIDDTTVKSPEELTRHGIAMHHVRSHLRLRLGGVELVRPHWRGDPRMGVVLHRHSVWRAEDEPGPWQGGPLPTPSVIAPLAGAIEEAQ